MWASGIGFVAWFALAASANHAPTAPRALPSSRADVVADWLGTYRAHPGDASAQSFELTPDAITRCDQWAPPGVVGPAPHRYSGKWSWNVHHRNGAELATDLKNGNHHPIDESFTLCLVDGRRCLARFGGRELVNALNERGWSDVETVYVHVDDHAPRAAVAPLLPEPWSSRIRSAPLFARVTAVGAPPSSVHPGPRIDWVELDVGSDDGLWVGQELRLPQQRPRTAPWTVQHVEARSAWAACHWRGVGISVGATLIAPSGVPAEVSPLSGR
ncbi:MAG: hypothetical protein EPO68_14785 [Planctomycetota bacterium]|nr:MAG: hypothetical protein EPO68_14785 [Planctomycetota bacterium]